MSSFATPEEYRQRPAREGISYALFRTILMRLENGESLKAICADRDMPTRGAFLTWVVEDPEREAEYRRAREFQIHAIVDEMVDIADGPDPQKARVQLEARKFLAERVLPRIYGPRSYMTTSEKPDAEPGGVDHTAEVRKKIEGMAARDA